MAFARMVMFAMFSSVRTCECVRVCLCIALRVRLLLVSRSLVLMTGCQYPCSFNVTLLLCCHARESVTAKTSAGCRIVPPLGSNSSSRSSHSSSSSSTSGSSSSSSSSSSISGGDGVVVVWCGGGGGVHCGMCISWYWVVILDGIGWWYWMASDGIGQ